METSNQIDLHSFTWLAIKHHAETELKDSQDQVERRNIEQRDSDFHRGRMSLAREILEMPNRGSEHASE